MRAWRYAFTLLLSLSTSGHAWAYCRATTCDPSKQRCAEDSEGCFTDGLPVFWSSDCISVSVQQDGAPRAGIDYEAARASVQRGLEAWTSVDCPGGGHPSLKVELSEPVACSEAEYNRDKGNANIVLFHDETWPYDGMSQDALGYTRFNFDPDTGELYDADIELNAVSEALSVGRKPLANEADLDSIITHELGHLLGLNHSRDVAATMVAGYQNGSIELRTPDADDIAGICAIYPPGRKASSTGCQPRHGFSALCGAQQALTATPPDATSDGTGGESESCALSRGTRRSGHGLGGLTALVLLGALRRRRAAAPH